MSTGTPGRWQALFADLEAQTEELAAAEQRAEVADRTRLERGRLGLRERLAPSQGLPLAVQVTGAGTLRGVLLDVGPDWLLLSEAGTTEVLVVFDAVLSLAEVTRRTAAPERDGALSRRLDLRWALRGLARSRAAVAVVLRDGSVCPGTLDQVGADHVDLAEHAAGEPRRSGEVRRVRVVPLPALALVRSS